MNKSRTGTFVAIPIIVFINVLISLLYLTTHSIENWAFDSLRFTQSLLTFDNITGEIATLFTSQFLHIGLQHVLTNMIMLVLFGTLVERELGVMRFLGYYLASGVVGILALWAFNTEQAGLFVGASASLSGITAAFLLLLVRRRMRLNTVTGLGGAYILLWWLPDQILGSILSATGSIDSNIGYLGHLFGFIAGAILTWRYSSLRKTENQPLV